MFGGHGIDLIGSRGLSGRLVNVSEVAGDALLRQAVMMDNKNIARSAVLLEAGVLLHNLCSDFNLFSFREDLLGEKGKDAFRKDLQESKYLGINRFPTLIIRGKGRRPVTLTGYQTYESLSAAVGTELKKIGQ